MPLLRAGFLDGSRMPPQGHILDSNTLALWRLDEAGALWADATGSYPLAQANTPISEPAKIGLGRRFPGGNNFAHNDADLAARNQFRTGIWTVEFWYRITTNQWNARFASGSNEMRVISLQGNEVGGPNENALFLIKFMNFPSDRYIYFAAQHASNVYEGGSPFSPNSLELDSWQHIAWRSKPNGLGTFTWDMFRNAVIIGGASVYQAPTGGSNAAFSIGSTPTDTSLAGTLDDIRISKIARSDAEILESYRRGVGSLLPKLFNFRRKGATRSVASYVAPNAPTGAVAFSGNAQAIVNWTPPSNIGSSALISNTVTSSPGGFTSTVAGSATTATVSGLTNGVSYTFTVVSTNSTGPSPASAASNSITPGTGHIVDSNTLALWKFNEPSAASNAVDATANAYDLTQNGSPTVIATPNGFGRRFQGTAGQHFVRTGDVASRLAMQGEFTIGCWIRRTAALTGYIFEFRPPFATAGNVPALLQTDTTGHFAITWDFGVGGTYGFLSASSTFVLPQDEWHLATARVRHVLGQTYVDLFKDGANKETTGPLQSTDTASGNNADFRVGVEITGPTYGTIDIDEICISKIARSDAEILSSFARGPG